MDTKLMKRYVVGGKVRFEVTAYCPGVDGYAVTQHTIIDTAIAEFRAVIGSLAGVTCSVAHFFDDGCFDCIVLAYVS